VSLRIAIFSGETGISVSACAFIAVELGLMNYHLISNLEPATVTLRRFFV